MVCGDDGQGDGSDCDCTVQILHFVVSHQRRGAQELPEECMLFAAFGHPRVGFCHMLHRALILSYLAASACRACRTNTVPSG